MEDKEKEIIVDEEKTEETPPVETPTAETPAIEPDSFMKILEAIADLKGDVANLIQKSEAIESPLEEPPAEETLPEEAPPEEEPTEISEEEQEDISDMFKD